MLSLSSGQLEAWIAQLFWPFVRIGACLMVAPIFGARFVPPRMRIVIAGAITMLVAPLLPSTANTELLSATGVVITAQQVIIGLALGFALQLAFEAVAFGGQLLANSMGLSFAMSVDPLHGASTQVLGQFYTLVVTLTFLALNGHLLLIQTLVDGFRTLPIGATGLGNDGLWTLIVWSGQLFSGALTIALPGMTALMIVNLGFGVISRAAPTLNLFAVGFPISLVLGLLVMLAGLPAMQGGFTNLLQVAFQAMNAMVGAGK
jgi:flagellar biosynthetic protein FliR